MFKYFTLEEFACQETGENEISEEFVHALDALRHEAGFPFVITAGIGLLVTVLKLKSLMAEDSTRQAALLILLLAMGFSVIFWLPQLLSSGSVESAWQKDLSM